MYFVRPTFLISAVAISFYVLFRHRKRWGATTAAAVLWLLAFVGYSFACFRSLVPPYYESSRLDFGGRSFWVAVAGNLISPSRGLVIFVPAVLIVFYLVLRYRSFLSNRAIVNVALVCVVGQLVLVSSYRRCEAGVCLQSLWWGGHSYGPRLMTDVLPWLVLLAIYGIEAQLQALRVGSIARQRWLRCSGWAAATAACSLSIVINGGGAISRASLQWNLRPTNIDWNPDRLWDWRDPQALAFLRGVRSPDIQRQESEPSPRSGSTGEARK